MLLYEYVYSIYFTISIPSIETNGKTRLNMYYILLGYPDYVNKITTRSAARDDSRGNPYLNFTGGKRNWSRGVCLDGTKVG